ncbi:MAG: hypothetical protein ACYCU0_00840 [Solirubrobacteraceae bacterium]
MAAFPALRRAHRLHRVGGAALIGAVALAGCGATKPAISSSHASTKAPHAPRGAGVPASAAAVIEGWSAALRAGNQKRAAAYWAHPSTMVNSAGPEGQLGVLRIDSARAARIADETLSCGATLTSTSRSGRYVLAEFTLSVRTGVGASRSGCSGPAAVDFLIRHGRIVRWLRAPTPTTQPPSGGREGPESSGGSIS